MILIAILVKKEIKQEMMSADKIALRNRQQLKAWFF